MQASNRSSPELQNHYIKKTSLQTLLGEHANEKEVIYWGVG